MPSHRLDEPDRGKHRTRSAIIIGAAATALLVTIGAAASQATQGTDRPQTATGHGEPVQAAHAAAPPGSHHGGPVGKPGGTGSAAPSGGAAPPADPNPNCSIRVPAAPLTAAGLATPYEFSATDRKAGPCHEANADQSAFVQATIIDPATGKLSVYSPLVVDAGTKPLVAPVVPVLPAGAVVGIWFGYNGDTLTLTGSLHGAHCVNGLGASTFSQYAYCNAVAFFTAANAAITAKKTVVPPAGTAVDGKPCPTVRDFALVDQDQSDNVTSTYLTLPGGRTAPNTAANRTALGAKATVLTNGSDNGLLDVFLDPVLKCTPFTAPDLADPGARVTSLALNELAAAADQGKPVALVPTNDPMTTRDGRISVAKTNLYRAGVDQAPLPGHANTGAAYCTSMFTTGMNRIGADKKYLVKGVSPEPDADANLYAFLADRLSGSFDELGCAGLLHKANPVHLVTDRKGVVVDAKFGPLVPIHRRPCRTAT